MKFKYLAVLVFFVASAFGAARAQNVKGVVYGADTDEPLIGASVYWAGTTVGTGADAEGNYTIHRVKGYDMLVAGFVGYTSDTIRVESGVERVDFRLSNDGVELEEVVVNSTLGGNYVKRDGILKGEMISFAGLCKMACCNLAESFENSASVTVGYSDAISGARQIKMLGLAGTYTQILDENRPIMRGLSAPYGLSYTPGMWLNSIQVSKGISSVTAGHEAITGQINLEHRKPTDDERLFINFYLDDELRPELNLSTALPVTKDKKLSTILLLHGSLDTHLLGDMDDNGDGFMDLPKTRLGAVANRWLYTADNGAQVRWGFKYLAENRLSGQKHYKASMREEMDTDWDKGAMYGSQIKNRELNAYFKFGARPFQRKGFFHLHSLPRILQKAISARLPLNVYLFSSYNTGPFYSLCKIFLHHCVKAYQRQRGYKARRRKYGIAEQLYIRACCESRHILQLIAKRC